MAFYLAPLALFLFFLGVLAQDNLSSKLQTPSTSSLIRENDGQQFSQYISAVNKYVEKNPTITGIVTPLQLSGMGYSFPTSFLGKVGNNVSTISGSTNGRTVLCYGNLATGALSSLMQYTSNDISIGTTSSGLWTTAASDGTHTPRPLDVALPNGYIVSVIQIGL